MVLSNSENWQSGVAILEDNVFEKQSLPEGSAIDEKRKDPRFNIKVPLQFRVSDVQAEWRASESFDVSNTGIRISLEEPASLGTKVELDILLPGASKNILIEGTVVWAKPKYENETFFEVGIAFQNIKRVTGKDKLLQFISDRLCNLAIKHTPKNLSVRAANSFSDLKDAFHLIYQEYHRRGYCAENSSELHYSFYCTLPRTRTLLLHRDENLLGTVSLIKDSPCGIPMESLFQEAIDDLRNQGRVIAEVSLLALNQEAFRKKSFSLTDFQKLTGTFNLFKHLFDYAKDSAGITDLIIAVHPRHEDLYHYLTFEKMGLPKSYSSANGKPALPMRLDINKSIETMPSSRGILKYFVDHTTEDFGAIKDFPWDNEMLNELLIKKSRIWNNLPNTYKQYIKECYPLFSPKPCS